VTFFDAGSPAGPQTDTAEVEALRRQGLLLQQLERLADAERIYEQILERHPTDFEALLMFGVLAAKTRRTQFAADLFGRAIKVNGNVAQVHNNLGIMLSGLGRMWEALASFDRAIALWPEFADAHRNRGVALGALKLHDQALESYGRAIALEPSNARNYVNCGASLQDLERLEEAVLSYDRAIALQPDYSLAFVNRGAALQQLQRFEQALASYENAILLNPLDAEAHVNKGLLCLLQGQFAQGWRLYEWRRRLTPLLFNSPLPQWQGGDGLNGKTLFVHAEQGLGDTIQFSRYVKLAEKLGARVILAVQPQLRRLLAGIGSRIEFICAGEPVPSADFQTALASLPGAFSTTVESIPADTPYLYAEPVRVERWRAKLGADGFRVGICWQGSTGKPDLGRSVPLTQFRRISTVSGVRLISLQKNAGIEQLKTLPNDMAVEVLEDDFDNDPDAFLDTAAVMKSLDLVITTDTSIAHLAGALRCPTWVVLKKIPDWRWLLEREDCPWYPELRLFRQRVRGDWDDVFARIYDALADLLKLREGAR